MKTPGEVRTRIICVGNRLAPEDDIGPRVYDYLTAKPLPDGVDVIDGGLQGLNLMNFVAGAARLIFVDALIGFGEPGRILVLDALKAAADMDVGYGHSGGLAYLLRMLPLVWEGDLPEISLVGVEGASADSTMKSLAETCLQLAINDV